jgi:uncharacterized protein (DUF58 family)
VTRRASPRLRAYLLIGAAGLIAGAAFGRPEPVLLAAPLLLAAIFGIVGAEDPAVSIEVTASSDRTVEGEEVTVELLIAATRPVPWLELGVVLPPGLAGRPGRRVIGVRLDAGSDRRVSIPVVAARWGAYRIDRIVARARDRLGFFVYETSIDPGLALRVYPRPEAVRRAVSAAETQVFAGDEVSRRRGDGIEFADVRPYAPGDQVRRVNWRLSSRRTELHVNELHPERGTDVVILLDTFNDLTGVDEHSSLTTAIRGANGLANHYVRRRDRVGLIAFGGSIRWLVPAMGAAQAYRIVDTLLDARVAMSVAWKGVDLIPPRSLPPKALILALTPLLDDRFIQGLLNLRSRGFDLVIVELGPERFVAGPVDATAVTARRLWRMRREQLRDRFRRLGVPVAAWAPDRPLEAVLEEVRIFRRAARRASA